MAGRAMPTRWPSVKLMKPGRRSSRMLCAAVWVTNYNASGAPVSGPTIITNVTDIGWVGTGQSPLWNQVAWNPIWGGTSGTKVTAQMYMWMDHLSSGGHV